MATPVISKGDSGPYVRSLINSINKRAKQRGLGQVPAGSVVTNAVWKLWQDVFEALGGEGFSGGLTAAKRRYVIVRSPGKRTFDELRRADKWRRENTVSKPKMVKLQVSGTKLFGDLGAVIGTVGHYTAGPRDTSDAHAIALWTQYHNQHKNQGWGFIGYHYGITAAGTIVLLRPAAWKGAHTGGHNTGRIGVVVHGGPGQRMTKAQKASWEWLKDNAHTTAMPENHRASGRIDKEVWGHDDLYPTACPGTFETDYKA